MSVDILHKKIEGVFMGEVIYYDFGGQLKSLKTPEASTQLCLEYEPEVRGLIEDLSGLTKKLADHAGYLEGEIGE